MSITSEEKIKKLEAEIASARTPKHKCNLHIDIAMELRHSNPAAALKEAMHALAFSEQINFALGKARSYFCMGLAHFNLSDYENSFVCLDQSLRIFTEAGDKWGISNALNNMGLIYMRLGDYTKALEKFSASLLIKKEAHDAFGTANVMISMATIQRETGNLADAQLLLAESLKISDELKYRELTAKGLMEQGIVLMMEHKFPEATEKFNEAKNIYASQNNASGNAQCFLYLGKIKSQLNDLRESVSWFEEGQKIAADTGDRSLLTVFLYNIAAEKLKAGEYPEAIALLQEAKQIAEKTQEKPVLSMISQLLSSGYEATGHLKEALTFYKNYIALKEEINSVETTTRLRNQQISAKVEALMQENRLLEAERISAVHELTTVMQQQEIRQLNAMMEGQEKERKRIATDLHDRVGSSLAAIKLHLTGVALSLDRSSSALPDLNRVASMFDNVVMEVRQVSHDLASGVLVKFGLAPALKDLGETIGSAGSIAVHFFSSGMEKRLDSQTEIALYRIVQELVSNVLKHAQATEINIYLHRREDHLSLMVEDNGMGFDLSKAGGGLGMKNMTGRVNQLRGTILFDSTPGNGCTVTIEIPVQELA